MATSSRRSLFAFLDGIRTTWLIIGASVLLLVMLEGCFRVKNAITQSRQGTGAILPGDPRALDWYADFRREYDAARTQRWEPFVYFGRLPSQTGRYINIDSQGRRVTPQPTAPATPAARVFMFGGSTMWGDSQRQDHTIAAEVARRLQGLVPAGQRVEVTNFGETGWVTSQELIQLELELRAGSRPDMVIFYDGLNDVSSTVQWGSAGVPQNESKRVAEFGMGRALDRTGFARGLRKDLRALGILTGQAFRQLALTDWLLTLKKPVAPTFIPADSAARATTRVYVENMRLVEALAAAYHFTPVYVWQPNLHASAKVPNPYEQRLLRQIARDGYHTRVQAVHRIIPPMIDSAMPKLAPGRFVDASDLFRADTMAVYTDWLGHNTEKSVPFIVDAFWPTVETAARAAIGRQRPVVASTPPAATRGPSN